MKKIYLMLSMCLIMLLTSCTNEVLQRAMNTTKKQEITKHDFKSLDLKCMSSIDDVRKQHYIINDTLNIVIKKALASKSKIDIKQNDFKSKLDSMKKAVYKVPRGWRRNKANKEYKKFKADYEKNYSKYFKTDLAEYRKLNLKINILKNKLALIDNMTKEEYDNEYKNIGYLKAYKINANAIKKDSSQMKYDFVLFVDEHGTFIRKTQNK